MVFPATLSESMPSAAEEEVWLWCWKISRFLESTCKNIIMIQAAKHSLSPVPRSSRWFLQSFRTFSLSLWAGLGFFRIISGWQISSAKFGWLLMELSQNYVKLLSLSSLSKNTWQNENLQSRYFNSSSLHTTLPSLLAVPKCPVVFTVYCCSPVFLPPAQWRPSSPAAWRDDSSLSMSDTGSSGVPATKVTSKHTLSRRIIWCNCKKNHQDIQSGLFFIEHYLFLQLERLPSHRHLLESHTALAHCWFLFWYNICNCNWLVQENTRYRHNMATAAVLQLQSAWAALQSRPRGRTACVVIITWTLLHI